MSGRNETADARASLEGATQERSDRQADSREVGLELLYASQMQGAMLKRRAPIKCPNSKQVLESLLSRRKGEASSSREPSKVEADVCC